MFFTSLIVSAVVATAIAAEGFVKLDFHKENAPKDIRRRQHGVVAENILLAQRGTTYWLDVSIGTPPQLFHLQLDTGSADLWVPDSNAAVCSALQGECPGGSFDMTSSSTFKMYNEGGFRIGPYGDGTSDSGDYFTDVVHLGGVTIDPDIMVMGLAHEMENGPSLQNNGQVLIGVGYQVKETSLALTGSLQGAPPTIYQALMQVGAINREAYSLYLDDQESGVGAVIFGGVDASRYSGDLVALPVVQEQNNYTTYTHLNVALTGISVSDGEGSRMLTDDRFSVSAVLDSGSTAQSLPPLVLAEIYQGLGAIDGFVPCRYSKSNMTLSYHFGGPGGPSITVSLADLMVPQSEVLNVFSNDDDACEFLVEGGNRTVLGDSFMRSGYFVFDVANNQIAIAQAVFNQTTASPILAIPTGTDIPGCTSTNTYTLDPKAALTSAARSAITTVAMTGSAFHPATPTFALGSAVNGLPVETHPGGAVSAAISVRPINLVAGLLATFAGGLTVLF